jgi:hypothetical protein
LPCLPAEARDILHAGQHAPGRRLVELHPDLCVGPESEPGEKVVLDPLCLQVVCALRADADDDVDAGVVFLDLDSCEVGALAKLVLSAELG